MNGKRSTILFSLFPKLFLGVVLLVQFPNVFTQLAKLNNSIALDGSIQFSRLFSEFQTMAEKGSRHSYFELLSGTRHFSDHSIFELAVFPTDGDGVRYVPEIENVELAPKKNSVIITGPTGYFFFGPESICFGGTVDFTFVGDSTIVPTWYFGDGDSLVGGHFVQHTYWAVGTFTPQVLMTDTSGATAFTPGAGNVNVFPLPNALIGIDPAQVCRNDTLFLADSTIYNMPNYSVFWDFGDGDTATGSSVGHVFTGYGPYQIIMQVTDIATCSASDTAYYSPIDLQADFYVDEPNPCIPDDVIFTDTTISDTNIVSWFWDFGDGNTGTGNPIIHSYQNNGSYDVTMIVTDALGCTDTLIRRKSVVSLLPEVPHIWAASVMGDEEVAISLGSSFNPQFDQFEVHGETGPGSYFYVDNSSNFYNPIIYDYFSNTLYASNCYRALLADNCGNYSSLDSGRTHCTIDLTAIPDSGAVNLVWNHYVGWDSILRYDIFAVNDYDTTANVILIGSVSGTETFYIDNSIVCDSHRTYRVRAIGLASLERSWSDTSGANPILAPSPESPELVVASVNNNIEIQVEWSAGSLSNVFGFDLERSLDNSNWQSIGNFPATTTQIIDQQVDVANQSYYYRVAGLDQCNVQTAFSNLGQSILLSLDPSGNDPVLSWNFYQEWDSVDHYAIEIQAQGSGNWTQIGTASNASNNFIDAIGIEGVTTVCYRITAFEFGGNNAISHSNEVCFAEDIWVPNTLTPNGDNFNDYWTIKGLAAYPNSNVTIFNRWGNEVYANNDYQNDWKGTNSATKSALPDGTYFYVLKISDGRTLKGQVTIMR